MDTISEPPPYRCPNCGSDEGIPLLCKACDLWVCSECWLQHDVEKMKEMGLLKCPCGDDHGYDYSATGSNPNPNGGSAGDHLHHGERVPNSL